MIRSVRGVWILALGSLLIGRGSPAAEIVHRVTAGETLHAIANARWGEPAWAELLVRDPVSLEVVPEGQEGVLQFISPIQTSYPGHSVLTEDVGVLLGVDDCPCGRKGSYFKVIGRAKQAEVRGCGDIMAEKFA